jgi:carbamoyl-phosphate synthase large subunit
MGIPAEAINKIGEGSPHVVDWIERGEVDLVINTPVGHTGPRIDGYEIRAACLDLGIPCVTPVQGAAAAVQAVEAAIRGEVGVTPLQTFHARLAAARADTSAMNGTGPSPTPVAVAGS